MKPRYIAYCIWIVIALLGVICCFIPKGGWEIGKYQLRFPTLTEALDIRDGETVNIGEAVNDGEAVNGGEAVNIGEAVNDGEAVDIGEAVNGGEAVKVSEAVKDTRAYLSAFYNALDSTALMPIRVMHYGDSQIEEDRITNILREQWQKQYGGGGVGLVPLHQTIPTRSIRQWITMNGTIQATQGGPKRYLVYGPRSMRLAESNSYGVMGQMAVMDSMLVKGSEDIVLSIEPIDKKRKSHNYFNRMRVLADSMSGYVIAQDTTLYFTDSTPIIIPDSTTECEIHLHGKGNIYGVSLENATGIIVDNIPMRGCSGNIFTKIDSTQLSNFYRETNTRLIILQFGGNMIPQTENPSTISGYVRSTLRQQVRYIRACAPQASILFIGPSDMSTNIDGTMTTYPLVPYMDKQLKKMAAEEQIAYWSMYDAMGGYNSMVTWVEKGLAGSDYVHFTRAGANNIGKKLYKWIEER